MNMHADFLADDTWSRRRRHDAEPDVDSRALSIVKNSAPDTKGVNNAAVASAATAQQALDWAKSTYASEAPDRAATSALDRRIAESQIAGMDAATAQATRDSERRRTVFEPLEDQIVADANAYDTPQRRAEAVARASADVESASGRAMTDLRRDALRYGANFDDGAARGGMVDMALGKARARVGAGDVAVRGIEAQGHARKMDAAGVGRGVMGSQATQQQIASQAGNAAVGANTAALGATMSGHNLMQQGFAQNMQGQQIAGNLYGQAARIKASSDGGLGAGMAGIGGIMQGLGAMGVNMSSSKKVKQNKRKVDGDEAVDAVVANAGEPTDEAALAAANATPVEAWNYKPGVADEATHIGGYAEDMRRTMGPAVAPGGVVVNMQQLAKNNGGAIAALAKKVEQIEAELAELGG